MTPDSTNPKGSPRGERFGTLAAAIILAAVAQFLAVAAVAMARYPGGNPWDLQAPGYSFWRNTLSDLTKSVANNGQPNPMYVVILVSTGLLALGMLVMWLRLPGMFPRLQRLGKAVRVLGLLSALGMIYLALGPADIFPRWHTWTIAAAALPGIAAFGLACLGMFLGGRPICAVLSLGLLVIACVHFGQYVEHFWLGWEWTPAMPATEKIAAVYVFAWLAVTAILGLRAPPNPAPAAAA